MDVVEDNDNDLSDDNIVKIVRILSCLTMIWKIINYDQDDCGGSPCAGAFDNLQPRLPLLHHRRDALLVADHQSHWMWAGSG